MSKLKVVTIVGTRPEIIRLSRLIPTLDEFTDHVLVHTGQNYDRQLNEVFFEDLELRSPNYYLSVDTSSVGSVMGDVIRKTEEVFMKERPDAVVILGDTNSALAAIVAERMHIPVYHLEAGNRSFDSRVPEELNRKIVDHVSTFNLPYNDFSMRNLLSEGILPRFINKSGSPIYEIYHHFKMKIENSTVLRNLDLNEGEYFLASLHREETVDDLRKLEIALHSLAELGKAWQVPVLLSTHPRTRKRLEQLPSANFEGIIFHEPFNYSDYCKLQLSAKCVVSDSGTVTEESAIMGFNAVIIRDATERPEGLESGSIKLVPIGYPLIHAVDATIKSSYSSEIAGLPDGYFQPDFSKVVLNFILSTAQIAPQWRGR
jgi:UDP-N-acetylglucosamine 2-epimerase (non-hydrolysing)